MKIFVLLGHQNPGSFNHAIASRVYNTLHAMGHETFYHDLYAEKFEPVAIHNEWVNSDLLPESVKQHTEELKASEGIIIIHPNWWGTPPAILKGWLDRVLRPGFAYQFTENGPIPCFTDKIVQVFTTSNTPREIELNIYNDPLEHFWKTIVFGLCGSKSFERRNFESVIMSDHQERLDWLNDVEKIVQDRFCVTDL